MRLLYHGRVDRRKGVLDFLDAFAGLSGRGVPFAATISGIGPDVAASRERAEALELRPDQVRFSGYVDYEDVPALYRTADVFVSPTHAEGFSNTILEAMATALPVVSCRSVGVVDCLRDGENGLLTEPGDVAGLTDALERIIMDDALRQRIAATALDECRRVYSWKAVGRQIMAIYAHVAATKPDITFSPDLPLTDCHFRAEPHLL